MIPLLRSELLKLRSVRSHQVMGGLAVGLGIGFGVLTAAIIANIDLEGSGIERGDGLILSFGGLNITQLLVGVLGILAVTSEYRHGTMRVTFAVVPARVRVVVAKAITVTATGLVLGVLAVAGSLVTAGVILAAADFELGVGSGTFWRVVAGAVALTALYGLAGVGIGAVLKSGTAAITLFVIWVMVAEPALTALLPEVGRWAPFTAGGQVMSLERGDDMLGPWAGLGVLAVFCAVVLVAGTVLVRRRDA